MNNKGYLKANNNVGTITFSSSNFNINISNNIVNQITFVSKYEGNNTSSSYELKLPSGGTYLVFLANSSNLSASVIGIVGKFSGGSILTGTSAKTQYGLLIIRIS